VGGNGLRTQDEPFERERLRLQGLGELECEGTAGEHLGGGVAGCHRIGCWKVQFHFVKRAARFPEAGGVAFSDDLQLIEPRAFAERAEVFE
jgi:hypothetical protein